MFCRKAGMQEEQVMRLVMSGADLVWWLAMRLARRRGLLMALIGNR